MPSHPACTHLLLWQHGEQSLSERWQPAKDSRGDDATKEHSVAQRQCGPASEPARKGPLGSITSIERYLDENPSSQPSICTVTLAVLKGLVLRNLHVVI